MKIIKTDIENNLNGVVIEKTNPEDLPVLDKVKDLCTQMISNSLFDMFKYYKPETDESSTLIRANCIEMSSIIKYAINENKFLKNKGVSAKIIPCKSLEFVPRIITDLPYEHAIVGIFKNANILGFLDPSYGVYQVLHPSNSVKAGSWEFKIIQDNNNLLLKATKSNKTMSIKPFLLDEATNNDVLEYQEEIKPLINECFSCILNSENGRRLNKLSVTDSMIMHRDFDGKENEFKYEDIEQNESIKLIDAYLREVEIYYSPRNLRIDRNHFIKSVIFFSKYVKNM